MTPTNLMDLSNWHLAEQTISSKGQKTCQLTADHKPVSFYLGSHLRTRFGASTYDRNVESCRKNLDFDITDDKQIRAMLQQIDEWTIEYIFAHGGKIMKKVMVKDIIKENYKSLLSMYGDRVSVKTKINTAGIRACQFWDEYRKSCDLPNDWLSNTYDVKASLPQLWIMGSSFGWTRETTDLLVRPIRLECPFISCHDKCSKD